MYRMLANLGLCVCVVVLGACQVRMKGKFWVPGLVEGDFEVLLGHPTPQPDEPLLHCGTFTNGDGIVYNVYCANGEIRYGSPVGEPNRFYPVREIIDLPAGSNATTFEINGAWYAIPAAPNSFMDDDFAGTADELLDEHGVSERDGGFDTRGSWSFDHVTGKLDVRFGLFSSARLPDPFEFPLEYETVVVLPDDVDSSSFIYQRIVGSPADVFDYLEVLGGDVLMEQISELLLDVVSTSEQTG